MAPITSLVQRDAGGGFDVAGLGEAASALPVAQLARADDRGRTLLHVAMSALFFFKAGDLSRLVPWPNASVTIYRRDVLNVLSHDLVPVFRTALSRAPALASASDTNGITLLHLAARNCKDALVAELLRAGANPLARTVGSARTPIHDASDQGCSESLALLLAAIQGGAERTATEAAVRAFATLAGAATLSTRRQRPRLDAAPPELPGAICKEGGGWDVDPSPTEAERETCDIDQVGDPSLCSKPTSKPRL